MKRILPFIIIIAVLGFALGSAWYLSRPARVSPVSANTTSTSNSASSTAPSQPVALHGAPGAEPAYTLGPANAPVQIEEFGDFQCPPCGQFHPVLVQMHKEFGDKLRITFREFPLYPGHQHSVVAASAAEAAGLQGKFWEMHDLLYEHQGDWKDQFDVRPMFEGYAKQIGLDIERWKSDIGSEQVAKRITLDGSRGHSLGVKGTPTVFMNGREVPFQSLFPPENLRVVIQNELTAGQR